MEAQGLFEFLRETSANRAGMCGGLQYGAGFFIVGVFEVEVDDDFRYAAWLGRHDFLYVGCACEGDTHLFGFFRHHGEAAAG